MALKCRDKSSGQKSEISAKNKQHSDANRIFDHVMHCRRSLRSMTNNDKSKKQNIMKTHRAVLREKPLDELVQIETEHLQNVNQYEQFVSYFTRTINLLKESHAGHRMLIHIIGNLLYSIDFTGTVTMDDIRSIGLINEMILTLDGYDELKNDLKLLLQKTQNGEMMNFTQNAFLLALKEVFCMHRKSEDNQCPYSMLSSCEGPKCAIRQPYLDGINNGKHKVEDLHPCDHSEKCSAQIQKTSMEGDSLRSLNIDINITADAQAMLLTDCKVEKDSSKETVSEIKNVGPCVQAKFSQIPETQPFGYHGHICDSQNTISTNIHTHALISPAYQLPQSLLTPKPADTSGPLLIVNQPASILTPKLVNQPMSSSRNLLPNVSNVQQSTFSQC